MTQKPEKTKLLEKKNSGKLTFSGVLVEISGIEPLTS